MGGKSEWCEPNNNQSVPCPYCTCIFSSIELTKQAKGELESISTIISCQKGETIFQQGSPVDGLYVVCQGRLKLARRMPRGRSLLIKFLDKGDIFMEAVLVSERVHKTYLKALEPSRVLCLVGPQRAQQWLFKHPRIANALLKGTAQDLFDLWRRLSTSSYGNPVNHIAALLVELAHRYGEEQPDRTCLIKRDVTKQELAQMAGVSRRSVTTYFNQLERQGLVSYEKPGQIVLLDLHRLRVVAEGG